MAAVEKKQEQSVAVSRFGRNVIIQQANNCTHLTSQLFWLWLFTRGPQTTQYLSDFGGGEKKSKLFQTAKSASREVIHYLFLFYASLFIFNHIVSLWNKHHRYSILCWGGGPHWTCCDFHGVEEWTSRDEEYLQALWTNKQNDHGFIQYPGLSLNQLLFGQYMFHIWVRIVFPECNLSHYCGHKKWHNATDDFNFSSNIKPLI